MWKTSLIVVLLFGVWGESLVFVEVLLAVWSFVVVSEVWSRKIVGVGVWGFKLHYN